MDEEERGLLLSGGDSKKACSTSRIVEVATAEKSAAVSTVGFSMGYPLCD